MKLKKPLHILIDGADNLGKSTVIQLLSRKLDMKVWKMPEAKDFIRDGTIEKVSEFYNKCLIQDHESDFIMDRGYTSSIVYSEVFKRTHNLEYIANIDQILKPKIFIFTGIKLDIDEVFEIEREWDRINTRFKRLAERDEYYLIDVYKKSPIEICNEILEKLSLEVE